MSKLDVFTNFGSYYVGWCMDGDVGAWVGQDAKKSVGLLTGERNVARTKRNEDDFEYLTVEIAAIKWVGEHTEDARPVYEGYSFESKRRAFEFLKAMRAALKAAKREFNDGVPWPEWAKTAEAAGWKPPKGWKP